jgi:hypothetical protein
MGRKDKEACNEMDKDNWNDFILDESSKKCIKVLDEYQELTCTEMNRSECGNFIPSKPLKKYF